MGMGEQEKFDFIFFPSSRILREYLRRIGYSGSIFGWIVKNCAIILILYAVMFAVISLEKDGLGGQLLDKYAFACVVFGPVLVYIVIIRDVKKKLGRSIK